MSNNEDWLQNPLRIVEGNSYKFRKLKGSNAEQSDRWRSFHFATRLKLDGADHFCRQVLGAASMPHELGLPLLAHRQLKWYLDAFFFELMSAYDTLLQELNIVYDLGLKPNDVKWGRIKNKLPQGLVGYMDEERKKEWFEKVRRHRNVATHHYLVPTGSVKGFGDELLDYDEHRVFIPYIDKMGNMKSEEISICIVFLKNMVRHISSVWRQIAQEFE